VFAISVSLLLAPLPASAHDDPSKITISSDHGRGAEVTVVLERQKE
jgi:hypothetical protein